MFSIDVKLSDGILIHRSINHSDPENCFLASLIDHVHVKKLQTKKCKLC
jgi:hypothetical protein